jgi:hypothetical protein
MRKSKSDALFIGIFFSVIGVGYLYFSSVHEVYDEIISFDDCVRAGFEVSSKYPETCKAYNKIFTNPRQKKEVVQDNASSTPPHFDYFTTSYYLDGQKVDLINSEGITTLLSAGSSTVSLLKDTFVDIENASSSYKIGLLRVVTPDHRTMYYTALAMALNGGYIGSNALKAGEFVSNPHFSVDAQQKIITLTYTKDINETNSLPVAKHYVIVDDILKEK